MREIVESYFKHRSLVNHQLASYNDCIPIGDGKESRMENIVRNIRIGSDEPVEDDEGGLVKLDLLDKEIIVRLKNLRLGRPTIKEANGAEHHATPMECRLRKLTVLLARLSRLQDFSRRFAPITWIRDGIPGGIQRPHRKFTDNG